MHWDDRRFAHSTYFLCLFFFNDTAHTEIYTLSLHDALPILTVGKSRPDKRRTSSRSWSASPSASTARAARCVTPATVGPDRKSTRLNSSHRCISYAVFCLKKKNSANSVDRPRYRICVGRGQL